MAPPPWPAPSALRGKTGHPLGAQPKAHDPHRGRFCPHAPVRINPRVQNITAAAGVSSLDGPTWYEFPPPARPHGPNSTTTWVPPARVSRGTGRTNPTASAATPQRPIYGQGKVCLPREMLYHHCRSQLHYGAARQRHSAVRRDVGVPNPVPPCGVVAPRAPLRLLPSRLAAVRRRARRKSPPASEDEIRVPHFPQRAASNLPERAGARGRHFRSRGEYDPRSSLLLMRAGEE